jgi:glycosyltransferase involved in cell wall biosynthesis
MKTVLLITDVNFWEKSSGNRMRIDALIKYLAGKTKLTVVNTGPAPENIEHHLQTKHCAEFFVLDKTKYHDSNMYGKLLKKTLKQRSFDVVIIEYIHNSYFVNFISGDPLIILDTHDIVSERTADFKKFNYQGVLYEMDRETEFSIIDLYHYVILICEPDYDTVKSIIGGKKVLLCQHPVKTVKRELRTTVKNIVFIASGYLPNVDAITYFIENCWHQISEKYAVDLYIYGTVCSMFELPVEKSIFLKGFIADESEIYDNADIIINPVRFGAGLKIKNVEALANGIPLVTTTHGSRGLNPMVNKGFLVADNTIDFIKAISSLIDNFQLRKDLSQCAQNFIRENFNAERCFAPLLKAIY